VRPVQPGAGQQFGHCVRLAGIRKAIGVAGDSRDGDAARPTSGPPPRHVAHVRLAQVQKFNSYLCSTVRVARAHRMRGSRWADNAAAIETMKRKVPSNVTECFELIEHKLMKSPWVMGDKYTIRDPYLSPSLPG
jgi:glutathione S-transferase